MGAGASARVEPQYKWDLDHKLRGPWTFLFKEKVQCACEGSRWCTRENPAKQKQPNAVPGLHCSWVGDNVLAMARPWQSNVEQYRLVEVFQKQNIGMILNLQELGEHAGCGPGNLAASGFTYDPEVFMAGGIGYYNFDWRDMGVPSLDRMMDIVQVMDYVTGVEKRKVAVHCHAGLGRTGLAIACFFVYTGMYGTPQAAIAAVRKFRPGAVQTSKQVAFVTIFGQYLQHLRCLFTPRPGGGGGGVGGYRSASPSLATVSAPATSGGGAAGGGGGGGLLPTEGLLESKEAGTTLVGVYQSGLTVTVPLVQQASPAPAASGPDTFTEEDLGLQQHLPWNDHFHIQPRLSKDFRPRPPATYTEALARQARVLHGPERRAFLRLHKLVKEAAFRIIAVAKTFKGPASGRSVLTLSTQLPSIPEDGAAAQGAGPRLAPGAAGADGAAVVTAALPASFAQALALLIAHHSATHVDVPALEPLAANPDFVALTGPKVDGATVLASISSLREEINGGQYLGLHRAPALAAVMLLESFFANFEAGPEPSSLTPQCIKVIAGCYQDLYDPKPPTRPNTPSAPAPSNANGGPYATGGGGPYQNGALAAAAASGAGEPSTSLELARQAYEILEPLEARDFELLLVFAALIRTVARASGPGCEEALVEVVRWVSGLLVGRRLSGMQTPSEAMLAFLSYLAGRDEAYAMMVLLKRQRIVGSTKLTSASGHADVAAMLQAEAAALAAAAAPPPSPPPLPAAPAPPAGPGDTPLDPYLPPSPDSTGYTTPAAHGGPYPLGAGGSPDRSGGGTAAAAGYLYGEQAALPALQLAQLLSQDIQQLYRVSFREEVAKLSTVLYPPPIATGRIDVHDVWR